MKLGKIVFMNPRKGWGNEAYNFTPWLANNIELLADALGIKIESDPRTEVQIGSFKADIIAQREGSESLILVENQLEETNHSHLGQLVTYASGLDIETIVWISPHFREKHRAAIDWLNSISESRFNFFGLQLELLRIGGSDPAPRLNIICRPNDWTRQVHGITAGETEAKRIRHKRRREYWDRFLRTLRSHDGNVDGDREPTRYNWNSLGIGKHGIELIVYCRKDSAWMALELDHEEWFLELQQSRSNVEDKLGFTLDWDGSETPGRCRMRHEPSVIDVKRFPRRSRGR